MEDEVLATMVERFVENYDPVQTIHESDFITTEDLFSAFQEFFPSEYLPGDLVEILSTEFKFVWSHPLRKFIWLIKVKK